MAMDGKSPIECNYDSGRAIGSGLHQGLSEAFAGDLRPYWRKRQVARAACEGSKETHVRRIVVGRCGIEYPWSRTTCERNCCSRRNQPPSHVLGVPAGYSSLLHIHGTNGDT